MSGGFYGLDAASLPHRPTEAPKHRNTAPPPHCLTFSVSHSGVGEVAKYIAGQEEHHRQRSFAEELKLLVERYGLKWQEDKTVETVLPGTGTPAPPR